VNRVLGGEGGGGGQDLQKGGEHFLVRSFMICTFHQMWHI
jgi:hypothetical protein